MLERFWHEIPPITRIIMLQQLVGLAIHSMGYAERYDLYFSIDKILWEGQVSTHHPTQPISQSDLETSHLLFLHQKNQHLLLLRNHVLVNIITYSYHILKNL